MPYKRYRLDLAFLEPLEPGLQGKLTAMEASIRNVKRSATKINAGLPNEEATTRAVYHRCKHDIGEMCEPEQEIQEVNFE